MRESVHGERLLQGLGEIREDIVQEAAEADADAVPKRRKHKWIRNVAVAACLAVVVFAVGVFNGTFPFFGGSSGGAGFDGKMGEESTFGFYTGPILPLSLAEPNPAIAAERSVTLDFSPWMPVWQSIEEMMAERSFNTAADRQRYLEWLQEDYPEGGRYLTRDTVLVQDETILTNTSDTDQTVTVLYPFVGRFFQLDERIPSLTVDGRPLNARLWAGRLTASFVEDDPNTGSRIVTGDGTGVYLAKSFADYRTILADGTYQQEALEPAIVPVGSCVWYTFSLPEGENDAEVEVRFSLDYNATRVYSLHATGGEWDPDGATMTVRGEGQTLSLLVLGEDIRDLEAYGVRFQDETWARTVAAVSQTRETGSAAEKLEALARAGYQYGQEHASATLPLEDFELYEQLFLDGLELCFRYEGGHMESALYYYVDMERVFYAMAEITIPAGVSVTVTAVSEKEGSHNYSCSGEARMGVEAYQLATRLGSTLTFQNQKAFLEDRGQIELVEQNFGFDLEKDIREALLTDDCYWLAVRRLPGSIPETHESAS